MKANLQLKFGGSATAVVLALRAKAPAAGSVIAPATPVEAPSAAAADDSDFDIVLPGTDGYQR
jgi:hypothetical protein